MYYTALVYGKGKKGYHVSEQFISKKQIFMIPVESTPNYFLNLNTVQLFPSPQDHLGPSRRLLNQLVSDVPLLPPTQSEALSKQKSVCVLPPALYPSKVSFHITIR